MSLAAVFFDLGGTLFRYADVRTQFDRMLHQLASLHSITAPPEEIRLAYRQAMARTMAEYRRRSFYLHRDLFNQTERTLLAAFGATPPRSPERGLYQRQIQVGLDAVVPREGVRETLEALRASDLYLAVVSNIDEDQFRPLWQHMQLGHLFDATTTSEEARSCKPDAAIYRLALSKAGLDPEEVAFVGDSPEQDVAGARAVGMTTVLIAQEPPAPSELEERLRPDHVIRSIPELVPIVEG